jgi:hypothetical protein
MTSWIFSWTWIGFLRQWFTRHTKRKHKQTSKLCFRMLFKGGRLIRVQIQLLICQAAEIGVLDQSEASEEVRMAEAELATATAGDSLQHVFGCTHLDSLSYASNISFVFMSDQLLVHEPVVRLHERSTASA